MYRLVTVIRSVSQSRSMVKVSSSSFRVMTPSMLKSYTTTPVRLDITKPEPFLDHKIVLDRVIEVIKNFEKVNASKITPQAKFKDDLDLDSLDAVEVVMALEEEFCIEIPDSEADKIFSIPDAVAYITGHPMAK